MSQPKRPAFFFDSPLPLSLDHSESGSQRFRICESFTKPLESECDAGEEERYQTLQSIAVQKMDAVCANKEKNETNIIQFGELYQFNEDAMNMIMRRRYSGSSYPEEAKNMQEFDFYEMNGFREAGNSRLLYKLIGLELN